MPENHAAGFELRGEGLTLQALAELAGGGVPVTIAPDALDAMSRSYEVVLRVLEEDRPIYGVNTGFGKFSEVRISREQLRELQVNLVRSHACGVGTALPEEIVRMILLAKANSLAKGFSGCRPLIAQHLVDLYNAEVLPVIPAQGSVGASGDLAPLAHLALVLIGEGEATIRGERMDGGEALRRAGIQPLELGPKEGLSILNGTQVSTAMAAFTWLRLAHLANAADLLCAWTVEGVAGLRSPFDARIHQVRGHSGAMKSARRIWKALEGSEILTNPVANRRVQDPYAIRCAPQVHGAVCDILTGTRGVLETELNGVTDNPIVFADSGDILSGGNFHAEPIAFVADQLAIAASELASISERRTFLLTDPQVSGLPAFLVQQGGVNSGFMLHQVTQAALVSANKTLSHPASVDSIPTSAGKEDHVSMAAWGAFKAMQVVEHTTTVLAIEALAAAQAVDMREPLKPSPVIAERQAGLRAHVPRLEKDRLAALDIEAARKWLLEQTWNRWEP